MSIEFSFKRDFKSIIWKETLWLNLLRSFFAGLVWLVVMSTQIGAEAYIYLLFPFMYLFILLPMALGGHILSSLGVPFAGVFAAVLSIMIIVGDPFVFFLHKARPEWVPVKEFSFVNFSVVMFVLDEETLDE